MFKESVCRILIIFAPTEQPKASARSAKNSITQIMQFSKRVTELARLHGVDAKDVLFAMLSTAGASTAEAFAVIYRPTVSTSAALSTKASNYIGQRPGLKRLIKLLDEERAAATATEQPAKRRGRPRKDNPNETIVPTAEIDYTNKDEMLKEAWEQYTGATTEAAKTKWYGIIVDLQRMKQEQNTAEEKRVQFYIPLTIDKVLELLAHRLKNHFQLPDNWEIEAVKVMREGLNA